MISGHLIIETSDDPRFIGGKSYPISIDQSVTLDVIESVTASVTPPEVTPNETATPVA